ncbi:hypothetical protein WJX81_003633, partial [Elliptochloris bilobata]
MTVCLFPHWFVRFLQQEGGPTTDNMSKAPSCNGAQSPPSDWLDNFDPNFVLAVVVGALLSVLALCCTLVCREPCTDR